MRGTPLSSLKPAEYPAESRSKTNSVRPSKNSVSILFGCGSAIGRASDGNPIPETVLPSKLQSGSTHSHAPNRRQLFFVRQILCDLVVARGAGDRDRDHCARMFLLDRKR